MLNEGSESYKGTGDVSVDILEFSRSSEISVEAKEDPDATENSSSFADTTSGNENTSELSDAEVESQLFGGRGLAPPFDGFGSVFPIRFQIVLLISILILFSMVTFMSIVELFLRMI